MGILKDVGVAYLTLIWYKHLGSRFAGALFGINCRVPPPFCFEKRRSGGLNKVSESKVNGNSRIKISDIRIVGPG